MSVKTKRVYDPPSRSDGYRVLVDAIWPRGLKKEDARLDEWMKHIAPTTALRQWFGHDPARWEQFKKKYQRELADKSESLALLRRRARSGSVTLLFAARDEEHNNAVVLKQVLQRGRSPH